MDAFHFGVFIGICVECSMLTLVEVE